MGEIFIATEDDGSQWVMLEDYQALQQKYLLGELALEEQIKRNSALLRAAEQSVQSDAAEPLCQVCLMPLSQHVTQTIRRHVAKGALWKYSQMSSEK